MNNQYCTTYVCLECNESITTGESDVLKHADKYGHKEFIDSDDLIYNPYEDKELMD